MLMRTMRPSNWQQSQVVKEKGETKERATTAVAIDVTRKTSSALNVIQKDIMPENVLRRRKKAKIHCTQRTPPRTSP